MNWNAQIGSILWNSLPNFKFEHFKKLSRKSHWGSMEIICSKTESLMIKITDYERMMSGHKIRNIQTQIEIPLAFCRRNDCRLIIINAKSCISNGRKCVRAGAAGARTRRYLGHHPLHPLILRLLVLCAPSDFEAQSSVL